MSFFDFLIGLPVSLPLEPVIPEASKDNQQQNSLREIFTKAGEISTKNHTTTDINPQKSPIPRVDVSGEEMSEKQVPEVSNQRSTTPNEHTHQSSFLSGYRHCALEVLRFMTQNMGLDPSNQVFEQLQAFLESTDILLSKDVTGTGDIPLVNDSQGNLLLIFLFLS